MSAKTRIRLNERQREIVRAVEEGLSYEEIAERLGIGTATLKKHTRRLCKMFDCRLHELPERVRARG